MGGKPNVPKGGDDPRGGVHYDPGQTSQTRTSAYGW